MLLPDSRIEPELLGLPAHHDQVHENDHDSHRVVSDPTHPRPPSEWAPDRRALTAVKTWCWLARTWRTISDVCVWFSCARSARSPASTLPASARRSRARRPPAPAPPPAAAWEPRLSLVPAMSSQR